MSFPVYSENVVYLALRRQQRFDAVRDAHPLLDKMRTFAMRPLGVFFLRARDVHPRAELALAAPVAHQDPPQAFSLQPDGLGPPAPAAAEAAVRPHPTTVGPRSTPHQAAPQN